jgi:hypothetical protein
MDLQTLCIQTIIKRGVPYATLFSDMVERIQQESRRLINEEILGQNSSQKRFDLHTWIVHNDMAFMDGISIARVCKRCIKCGEVVSPLRAMACDEADTKIVAIFGPWYGYGIRHVYCQ